MQTTFSHRPARLHVHPTPWYRHLCEGEVEQFMIRQLQDPAHEAHADFQRKTRQVVRLPTDQLVGALNEHVSGVGRVGRQLGAGAARRMQGTAAAQCQLRRPPSSHPCPPLPPARPQLTERRQGNEAYRRRDFAKALHHYERAKAVVEFVQVGCGRGQGKGTQGGVPAAELAGGRTPAAALASDVMPRPALAPGFESPPPRLRPPWRRA